MYPYFFALENVRVYDVLGVLGYVAILIYGLAKQNRPSTWKKTLVWLLVQGVAYTFGGTALGNLVGRGTEFFGYVTISMLGTVLAALMFGDEPLAWLDKLVPLSLFLAAFMKIGCFCGGCCNGLPFAYGFYNQSTMKTEFPIQLVEGAVYLLLLCGLVRYQGRPGRRYFWFLIGYAAMRFVVQFFRADRPAFSLFHWMSFLFLVLGIVALLLEFVWHSKQKNTLDLTES